MLLEIGWPQGLKHLLILEDGNNRARIEGGALQMQETERQWLGPSQAHITNLSWELPSKDTSLGS